MDADAIRTMRAVPVPEQMKHLATDPVRGIPIPWFTPVVDGKPEFRAADGRKQVEAVRKNLCWVCGRRMLNRDSVFVVGPMCLVNRNSAETRAEVLASVESGVPLLGEQCRTISDHTQLAAMLKAAERWYPIGA